MMAPTTYQADDVQQILQLALARQDDDGEFTREQLLEIAEELNISPDCLAAAETAWLTQKQQQTQQTEFDLYRRDRFRHRAVRTTILIGLLSGLDIMAGGGLGWSRYTLLMGGTVILWRAWQTFQPKGAAYFQELERWEQRRQLKSTVRNLWQSFKKQLQA